jgi:hypothetical protein
LRVGLRLRVGLWCRLRLRLRCRFDIRQFSNFAIAKLARIQHDLINGAGKRIGNTIAATRRTRPLQSTDDNRFGIAQQPTLKSSVAAAGAVGVKSAAAKPILLRFAEYREISGPSPRRAKAGPARYAPTH